jgi:hypothetical protein
MLGYCKPIPLLHAQSPLLHIKEKSIHRLWICQFLRDCLCNIPRNDFPWCMTLVADIALEEYLPFVIYLYELFNFTTKSVNKFNQFCRDYH